MPNLNKECKISKKEFSAVVRGVLDNGTSRSLLTKTFGVNAQTLERWATGRSAPHPEIREAISKTINEILHEPSSIK